MIGHMAHRGGDAKHASSVILSAAVSGILLGLPATSGASSASSVATPGLGGPTGTTHGDLSDAGDNAGEKHACKGQNDCKGQGGCKTDAHACKGQNACKGQGGCHG